MEVVEGNVFERAGRGMWGNQGSEGKWVEERGGAQER